MQMCRHTDTDVTYTMLTQLSFFGNVLLDSIEQTRLTDMFSKRLSPIELVGTPQTQITYSPSLAWSDRITQLDSHYN